MQGRGRRRPDRGAGGQGRRMHEQHPWRAEPGTAARTTTRKSTARIAPLGERVRERACRILPRSEIRETGARGRTEACEHYRTHDGHRLKPLRYESILMSSPKPADVTCKAPSGEGRCLVLHLRSCNSAGDMHERMRIETHTLYSDTYDAMLARG